MRHGHTREQPVWALEQSRIYTWVVKHYLGRCRTNWLGIVTGVPSETPGVVSDRYTHNTGDWLVDSPRRSTNQHLINWKLSSVSDSHWFVVSEADQSQRDECKHILLDRALIGYIPPEGNKSKPHLTWTSPSNLRPFWGLALLGLLLTWAWFINIAVCQSQ